MLRQKIAEFFSIYDWMPDPKEVGDPREFDNNPIFFLNEYFLLKIALICFVGAMIFFGVINIRAYATVFHGMPESGAPISELRWFALVLGGSGLIMVQIARNLFARQVNNDQFEAMVQWHNIIDGLPVPNREMTKYDLTKYVNAAYKWESERLQASHQQSIFNL